MGWDAEDAEAARWETDAARARWGDVPDDEPDPNEDDEEWVRMSNERTREQYGYTTDEPIRLEVGKTVITSVIREIPRTGDKIVSNTASELRKLIEQAQTELARLEARPAEPHAGIADTVIVITFPIRYHSSSPRSKTYHFAAIRVAGKWYVTGATGPNGVTWSRLWDWIDAFGTVEPGTVQIAGSWRDL